MGALTLGLFSTTHIVSSLVSPTKTGSTVLKCPKLYKATLFFYKNVAFQGQAEYSYFSADFRL